MLPQKNSGITEFRTQDNGKNGFADPSCGYCCISQGEKALTCWWL